MQEIKGFIERFHHEHVVLIQVDQTLVLVKRAHLPPNVHVGDYIIQCGPSTYRVDPEITERRRQEMRSLNDDDMG